MTGLSTYLLIDAFFYSALRLYKPYEEKLDGLYQNEDEKNAKVTDFDFNISHQCDGHCCSKDSNLCYRCTLKFFTIVEIAFFTVLLLVAIITAFPMFLLYIFEKRKALGRIISTILYLGLVSLIYIPQIGIVAQIVIGYFLIQIPLSSLMLS